MNKQRILHIMDSSGDTQIDLDTLIDVRTGEPVDDINEFFANAIKTRLAYEVLPNGEQQQIFEFNPTAEKIIILPPQVGG